MSVIHRENDCILLQHYRQVHSYQNHDGTFSRFRLKKILFENFARKGKSSCKQSKSIAAETDGAAIDDLIRGKVDSFLASLRGENLFSYRDETSIDEIKTESFKLLNKLYADSSQALESFHGENNLDHGKNVQIGAVSFLIPPRCRFFNKSIKDLNSFLDPSDERNKFDFLVIDPPWQNRYIKRVKKKSDKSQGYQMMCDEEIASIPLSSYLKSNSIVVVWCTNSESHIQSFKSHIINQWNLKVLSSWLWIKLDANGGLFNDFNKNKKPYERIFIATVKENCDFDGKLKDDLIILSQPSAIHSHKPPLLDLFLEFLPPNPNCLEIFARNLNENFTSIGLEVLKLQNTILFEDLS